VFSWKGKENVGITNDLSLGPMGAGAVDFLRKWFVKVVEFAIKMKTSNRYFDLYIALLCAMKKVPWTEEERQLITINLSIVNKKLTTVAGEKYHNVALDTLMNDKNPNTKLSDLYDSMRKARQTGQDIRNVGAREYLTKGMADMYYPAGPSGLRISAKFNNIMRRFPSLYTQSAHVYGVARNAFYNAISDNPNIAEQPGERKFYDISPIQGLGGKFSVEKADFYALGTQMHEDAFDEEVLIDDVHKAYENDVTHAGVTFKKGDFWHKFRVVANAGFKEAVIKCFINKMAFRGEENDPIWTYLATYFQNIQFVSCGKQQSAEFFVILKRRQADSVALVPLDICAKWRGFVRVKCATMKYFNNAMNYGTFAGVDAAMKMFFSKEAMGQLKATSWERVFGHLEVRGGKICFEGFAPFKLTPSQIVAGVVEEEYVG
jgi:hypothetical protein